MKVLCIDNKSYVDRNGGLLREGKCYNTVYEGPCYSKGKDEYGYALGGFERWRGFHASRFIPLSDIDETEFVRETKKELV